MIAALDKVGQNRPAHSEVGLYKYKRATAGGGDGVIHHSLLVPVSMKTKTINQEVP